MSDLEDPHRGSRGRYAEFRSRKLLWIQALIALCIVVALFSMGMGAYKMSVMEVLTLACGKGATLTLAVDDPQDAPVLDALAGLVERGFEE